MQIQWSLETNLNVFEKNNRGWNKKDKKIDWNASFNKIFYMLQLKV